MAFEMPKGLEVIVAGNGLTKFDSPNCLTPEEEDSLVQIDLASNALSYSDAASEILSFTNCATLNVLAVTNNPDLQLHVDINAFSDEFLNSDTSIIYMDESQWNRAVVDASYG